MPVKPAKLLQGSRKIDFNLPNLETTDKALGVAGSYFSAKDAELRLFAQSQRCHLGRDESRVSREYLFDASAAAGRQVDEDRAAVSSLALAADEAALFEVIDQHGDVGAAAKELFGEGALVHRAEVQDRFEDAELADGQMVLLELARFAGLDRVRGANEIDVSVERAGDGF